MSHAITNISPNKYARTAGLLYLLIAVCGAFSIGYVPSVIIVAGDAAATVANLQSHLGLFKLGILGDVVVLLTEIVLTAMLYVMFRPVSPTLSLIAALSRTAMVLVMAINLLINIMPILIPNSFDPLLTLMFFNAHDLGVYIWQLFFSLHLVALGYMILKSTLFPRVLGWMMLVGSLGYFGQGLAKMTLTENDALTVLTIALLVLVTIGELAFAFWLLIKGIKTQDLH